MADEYDLQVLLPGVVIVGNSSSLWISNTPANVQRKTWDRIPVRSGTPCRVCSYLSFPCLWTKTNGFKPVTGFNLDGAAYFEQQSPDDMAGIRWLRDAPPGVVVEAVGSSYSEYGRVATLSGQPNVLGWPGHESQWRGGSAEMGSRQPDIELIYAAVVGRSKTTP